MNFEQLATIIADTHQRLQQSAVKAVNQCQTMRNWLIGFYIVEFEQNGELYISTEDGSVGTKGNVMDAIRENALEADMIYACGPTPMLRAIKQYAEENGIECYISLEERMACGIGACLACVCKSKEKDAHSNVNNKRICKDGPVFLSTEVEI